MAEKILIVDDDVDSLKLIQRILERQGFDVVVADSGGKALEQASQEDPDLIILDVMMPDMNGLEVCRRLRASEKSKETPIIMFTAKTMIDDKVKGFEAGIDDYLTKPTHPVELSSRVKALLARKAQKTQSSPPQKAGLSIGVLGVKGGVGTTTLALNIALALIRLGEEAILADLRPDNPSIRTMMGIKKTGNKAGFHELETITSVSIQEHFVPHETGLRLLIPSVSAPITYDKSLTNKAVATLRAMCDIGVPVVADMGSGITEMNKSLLAEIDTLLFVIEANSVAIEIAAMQLQLIEEIIGSNKVHLVIINRSEATLPWHEVEQKLNREIKMNITAAHELALQSLEERKPIILLQPNAMISGQFSKLAEEVHASMQAISSDQP